MQQSLLSVGCAELPNEDRTIGTVADVAMRGGLGRDACLKVLDGIQTACDQLSVVALRV